ncbi:hypothetical protein [Streptomyces mirabilis]|uniref:hypothetical protein n=1 Tax=Streptomyces mirabilis TaxID=68239 RepID=UPI0036AF70F9
MTDQPIAPVRRDLMPCIPPSDWEFYTAVASENGVAVYRDELPGRAVVRRRITYGDWEPVHPARWAPEPPLDGNRGIAAAPTPPQDGPHAPQDGRQRPDAGAETPDGTGGAQAGAEGREVLREKYAAAVECAIGLNVDCGGTEGVHRVRDAVLAVRDRELERLEKLHQAHLRVEQRLAGESVAAEAALARIRLHIAVHRQRLRLADPVLLGRLEAVLREVGELEAAAGERP